jgi:hypothetical protein
LVAERFGTGLIVSERGRRVEVGDPWASSTTAAWRLTWDRSFLLFSLAFWTFAVNWIALAITEAGPAEPSLHLLAAANGVRIHRF